jgi:pSer/pThr/pTyr-binding forkhead associated (FHA) protein
MEPQVSQTHAPQNGLSQPERQMENPALLYLTPINSTFENKTITVPFYPDVLRIGRQTNDTNHPTPENGYFDSKVMSRHHAEVWSDRNGKIWIRDTKSSNGTFVNGERLSQENTESDPHELREQDVVELGIDIISEDQKTVMHPKIAARVEHVSSS